MLQTGKCVHVPRCQPRSFFAALKTVHVEDTKADTLFMKIKKVIEDCPNLQFHQIRGLGFDGASNMSGCNTGLQTLIRQEVVTAIYVHCCNHHLNLIVENIGSNVIEYQSVMGALQKIYTFIAGSPKRMNKFTKFQDVMKDINNEISEESDVKSCKGLNQTTRLQSLSEIRVIDNYTPILDVMEWLIDHPEEASKPENVIEAKAISEEMQKPSFIFWLHVMCEILTSTELLNKTLQGKKETVFEAYQYVDMTMDAIQELNAEASFEKLWQKSAKFASNNYISWPDKEEMHQPRKGRRTSRPNRLMTDFVVTDGGSSCHVN